MERDSASPESFYLPKLFALAAPEDETFNFSAARIFALRDRGLRSASSWLADSGFFVSTW
jgi:hypothetical protein